MIGKGRKFCFGGHLSWEQHEGSRLGDKLGLHVCCFSGRICREVSSMGEDWSVSWLRA